jgi:rhodanese-related sulfurtransferase
LAGGLPAPTPVNFLLDNWIWLLTAAASGGALLVPMLGKGGGADAVSPAEAVQMINREKAVVIDVCESAEFSAGHVVGARSIPLATLEGSKGLPTNKNLPVVLVCASGTRARRAAATVRGLGHQRVHVLQGGMAGWREAGLPTEKSA